MKNKTIPVFSVALLAAAVFIVPSIVSAYSLIGGNLGIATSGNGYQRDLRVWNNAADASANDNTTPDPQRPGALGATLAVWKASQAWNSNTTQAQKNFDYDWQGATTSSTVNGNMVFWSAGGCGGGTLAFTETPISDGWRIIMCENWTWADGPGGPSFNQIDIQGVAAHELGHALGLGHSGTNCGVCSDNANGAATMCPSICGNGFYERTIQTDDANGLQAIYGVKPANKPAITGISGGTSPGQTLTITGSNFVGTVNVKFTAATTQNTGAIPGTVYGVTPISATQINVVVPNAALDGNVLVWSPSLGLLSNPWPIDIGNAPPPPPSIASVTPGIVQAFAGGTITLSGSGFTGTTQVNSGGTLLAPGLNGFSIVNDNTITYAAPTASALGLTTVAVTTPNGTSNNGSFSYVETSPPKVVCPAITAGNINFTWNFGGPANDLWFLVLAINDNSTFGYNGMPILLNSFLFANGSLNAAGIGSQSTVIQTGLGGSILYSQILTFDGVADIQASSIVTSNIVF